MTATLAGGLVVTGLHPPNVVEADVTIDGNRVAGVGRDLERTGAVIDCSGSVLVPGNVCGHTHLYSSLARGMPYRLEPPVNFLQILQRVWWRLDRALDEESVRASALVGGMEALLAGTTTVVDHHASPNAIDGSLDVVADALAELGVRSILAYEVTDRDGPQRASAGTRENRRFLADITAGGRPLARGMVGAHASFTLSNDTLAGCVEAAGEADAGIHIHVAEDAADERDAEQRFGLRVVERLEAAGALDERSLLAHCVHVDPREVELIRASGATVAHNPRSNMHNGVGRAPIRAMDRVVLGTDGIGADLFAEAQAAYWRSREEDLASSPTWPLEALATGAAFAGRAFDEPTLGRIEPGAPADLVVLDPAPPTPLTAASLAGHWMFGFTAARVRDVFVAGEAVVRDRRLTRVDQDKLVAEATASARRLWERMERIEPHPFELDGS